MGDEARLRDQPSFAQQRPVAARHSGARRFADDDARLARTSKQVDGVLTRRTGFHRAEVVAAQTSVTRDAAVGNRAVERRPQLDPPRPVLGHDRGLERRQVRLSHVDEPPLGHTRDPAFVVAGSHHTREQPMTKVELLAVSEQLETNDVEPVASLDPERQR